MGNILSAKEQRSINSQIQGFEPASLASIIWDSINKIGVDDEQERLGIHFEDVDPSDDLDSATSRVTFWDGDDAQQMSRKVFLEVMLLVGETTIKNYQDNYDLERSTEVKSAVDKLRLAVQYLQKEIAKLEHQPGAGAYRTRLDSGINMEESSSPDVLVEEVRARRGSWMWSSGESDPGTYNMGRRRSTKGIEGVLDRLPELRRRYSQATEGSQNSALGRVKSKLKAISLIQRVSLGSSEAINEEPEEEDDDVMHTPPSPSMFARRRSNQIVPMNGNLLSPQFVPNSQFTLPLPFETSEPRVHSATAMPSNVEENTDPPAISAPNLQGDY